MKTEIIFVDTTHGSETPWYEGSRFIGFEARIYAFPGAAPTMKLFNPSHSGLMDQLREMFTIEDKTSPEQREADYNDLNVRAGTYFEIHPQSNLVPNKA